MRARLRSTWVRAALAVALLLVTGAAPLVGPAAAGDLAYRPADGVLTLSGRGYGHGRGLSQYGAHGAALRGLGYPQILAHYYDGAALVPAGGTLRRVLITGEDGDASVSNTPGLKVRDEASGAVLDVGARGDWAAVRVRADATVLRVEALQSGAWVPARPAGTGPVVLEGPASLRLAHPAGARTYRGSLRAALSQQAAKPLYVVNVVGLEDYLRSVVPAEMPAGWHVEALKAQAVAARSYGIHPCPQPGAYPATALYDVVDTTSCQVYAGVGSEQARTDTAVTATAGQVLRYGTVIVRSEFSASNGGWTLGAGGPYVAKEDPYDAEGATATRSDVNRWTGVRVPMSTLESAFSTGLLREVRVLERDGRGEWGGRVLRVRLVGDVRTVEVTGEQFRAAARLRSSWFDLQASAIDLKHSSLGGNAGFLGAPVAPEADALGGRFRNYSAGAIYWSGPTGAFEVHGAIRETWSRLGWERGALGFPVTDERATPDGVGRYNHFQHGSVYWTPGTGAREVRGAIRQRWAELGWERSGLGYPTSDEYSVPGGRRGDFQRGSILWDAGTGRTTVVSP